MKLRRVLFFGGALLLLLIVFVIDLIRKNVALEAGGVSFARDLMIIGAFVLLYLVLHISTQRRAQSPMKKLGVMLIATLIILLLVIGVGTSINQQFDAKEYALLPLDYGTQFIATILGISLGAYTVLLLLILTDLVLYKRKRSTARNFRIFLVCVAATACSTFFLEPLESSILTGILYGLSIVFALVNSFRLSWIVYLTKKEKIFSLIYGFFLFLCFIGLNVGLSQFSAVHQSLLYYSYPLKQFISLMLVFGNVYAGMAFISTLFHLPTAEAFDRKTTEVASLHNLSRLVTQVFDFDELVETVTSMTLQVCEAKGCWLEIIQLPEVNAKSGLIPIGSYDLKMVGVKNISQREIELLLSGKQSNLRDEVLLQRKPIVIDDVSNDQRFKHLKKEKLAAASMVVVPLVSHTGPIGILYATKDTPHGFFKDDVDVISAFADQATVAIENSRLIKTSIEREHLIREMMLAQEMQRKLLPQTLPQFPTLELDAISTPAFEVGGDYYDFLQLDSSKLGIIVGDVSGKGVSAAFYMSEVKGIFQSLCKLYPSPREFVIKANEVLASSIDKHSFISLIYAVVDFASGTLTLSRAGHCPMLYVSEGKATYIRPSGMGLGLSKDSTFSESMEEQTFTLREGDVCVLYTDGVTEARRGDDEFGYERLMEVVLQASTRSAAGVKAHILESVNIHVEQKLANDDDLTIVVLKWLGNGVSGRA